MHARNARTAANTEPLGVEGITANWMWLDEGGQMPRLAWTISKSRVAIDRRPDLHLYHAVREPRRPF